MAMTVGEALATIAELAGARHVHVNWPVAVALAARAAEGHEHLEDRLTIALAALLNAPSSPLLTVTEAADRVQRHPLTQRRVLILEAPPGDEPIGNVFGQDVVQGSTSLMADADEVFVFRGDEVNCVKHRDSPSLAYDPVAVAIQRRES